MASILKTTTCELTFEGSTVTALYLVTPSMIFHAKIRATGPYQFEIVEEGAKQEEILSVVFQRIYFIKVKEYEYRLTISAIDEVENNAGKMEAAIKDMNYEDISEVFIMRRSKADMISTISAMSSLNLVHILEDIMEKDPNVKTAMTMVFNEWVMKRSKSLMDDIFLGLAPTNGVPN